MTIKEQLMEDFKAAMKAHDEMAKNTISFARAAVKQMRKDALADFAKAGRDDLLEQYNKEIEILEKYLPAKLSEDELMKVIEEAAAGLGIEKGAGPKLMGKLMGPVMGKVKGVADGGDVKRLVQQFLS